MPLFFGFGAILTHFFLAIFQFLGLKSMFWQKMGKKGQNPKIKATLLSSTLKIEEDKVG